MTPRRSKMSSPGPFQTVCGVSGSSWDSWVLPAFCPQFCRPLLWRSHTTTFDIPYIEQPPGGNDYMTSRPSIVNFRCDRGYYAITVGIHKGPDAPIIFILVDDLKLCPAPRDVTWTPGPSTAKSLCASTVAFRQGYHISKTASTPSVDVSAWNTSNTQHSSSDIRLKLDNPIDLTGHILSVADIRGGNKTIPPQYG